jgi:hypothetical protein
MRLNGLSDLDHVALSRLMVGGRFWEGQDVG